MCNAVRKGAELDIIFHRLSLLFSIVRVFFCLAGAITENESTLYTQQTAFNMLHNSADTYLVEQVIE